jgi:HEPN domain-containing protein
MKRNKTDLVKAWLEKAKKDLEVAKSAKRKGISYADIACFHAQQSAEKALKAYLVWLEVEFPKTHVLEDLLDLIAPQDTSLESWRETLQAMTPFAVEIRYPESSTPSVEETNRAIRTAGGVLKLIQRKVSNG